MPFTGDDIDAFNKDSMLFYKDMLKLWLIFSYLQVTLLGPHDRNFLVRINHEKFSRYATEQNTRLRQEVIFARTSEALELGNVHFRLLRCLDRLRDITRVKKHIFLANLTNILKHSSSV